MSTTCAPTLEDLKLKTTQSSQLIEKLKRQIELIKLANTPAYIAEKKASLTAANAQLKSQIEKLVKDLEQAELKNPKAKATATAIPQQAATIAVAQAEPTVAGEGQTNQKKVKQPKTPQPPKDAKAPVDINVSILDIRVGRIVECEKHPDADSLYVEKIDLGEGKLRVVCSGLVKHIPLENMLNKLVVCICNLKPAKMRGIVSEAMVLCASTPDKVELVEVPAGTEIGDRVTCAGFEGEPVAECTPKNNYFGLVAVDLMTNETMTATYKGSPLEIKGKGPLKSVTLASAPVK